MASYEDLDVWRRSLRLSTHIFEQTNGRAKQVDPDLVRQVRRSLASIGANLAEGRGQSDPQFQRYIKIALGSAKESDHHLIQLAEVGALNIEVVLRAQCELAVIRRQLIKLMSSVAGRSSRRPQ